MKFLYKDITLSRNDYTNHSIRATVITNLDKEGFEARHIIAVTGHKSESTIKQYSRKCPNNKKCEMYEALGSKLMQKKPRLDTKQGISVGNISESAQSNQNPPKNTKSDVQIVQTTPDMINFNDNIDLLPFDETTDDMLLKVLNDLETQNSNKNPQATVTNTISNTSISAPVHVRPNLMPQMYFPHSTVTINYNFNSK